MNPLDTARLHAGMFPLVDPRAAQLEVLNEVARIATTDLELRPMLQRITDTLAAKFDWQFVALITIDAARNAFVCEAMTSTVPTSVFTGYGRGLGSGVVGQVASSGEPVLIDDVRDFPNYVETMEGAQSELCVPVKHHGRLVAVLNVESTRRAAFHEQLPLLTTVADQIAGAIANAQAHEELRQRARLMQMMSEISRTALEATDLRALLDRMVRYIHSQFPLEVVSIVLADHETEEYIETATAGNALSTPERRPFSEGVVGRAIREARAQLVDDVRRDPQYIAVNATTLSELAVPILFQESVLGVLDLESTSADVFTPANVLVLEAFANQMAGAIHLASLNERLADTTQKLEAKTHALEQANEHLANAIETLHRISTQDGLTAVANRRHFDETLAVEWRRAARSRTSLALLLLDIDAFKAFNDAVGHQAGDECLRQVAQTMRESVQRAADLVARYGGEEFAVLLPETDGEQARTFAGLLRERVEQLTIRHPASSFGTVTVSIGVAAAIPPRDSAGPDLLVRAADEALYEAKRLGRNRVV